MITGASLDVLAHPHAKGLVRFGQTPFLRRTRDELCALGIPAPSASLYLRAVAQWQRAHAKADGAPTQGAEFPQAILAGVGHAGARAAFNRSLDHRVLDLTPGGPARSFTADQVHAAKVVLTLNDQLIFEALGLVRGTHAGRKSRYVRIDAHGEHVARRAHAAQIDMQSLRARMFSAVQLMSVLHGQRLRLCMPDPGTLSTLAELFLDASLSISCAMTEGLERGVQAELALMKAVTAWIVVASTASLIGDPGPHPLRMFRERSLSAHALTVLGDFQRHGGAFEQIFSIEADHIRFHVLGRADYLVHALAKHLASKRGAHLGDWFEDVVRRQLATQASGWRVGRNKITAPTARDSPKYDADLVLVDNARQQLVFVQIKYLEFPQFPYLADVLATCVVGNDSRSHGVIAKAYFQLDGIRRHLQEPRLRDQIAGAIGVRSRHLAPYLDAPLYVVIHNVPELGFCDFHGVRLYEWNALRNLIQGNDFHLAKLGEVTARVKSMWRQCLKTSIEPLVSEPAEAILNAEFAFQVPRHAWLPFGQTKVRCPAPY